jgi:lipopolysaccharide biosynthesis protein
MNSVCLFASYYAEKEIPYYITVYLIELKKHFTKVIFLTTKKTISQETKLFLKEENLSYLQVENKGFDFGQWYQAFQALDINNYDQVALVNDSCILFKSLDELMHWSQNNKAEVQGITMSEAISPHIQSYFLILNKKAIALTQNYFNEYKKLATISEVIHTYEVGLSKYWQEQGLKISSYMDNNGYVGEFSPYYYCVEYHINKGIPLIKKKIMFNSYRSDELLTLARMNFKINVDYYLNLISISNSTLIVDLKKIAETKGGMTTLERLTYKVWSIFFRIVRPINKLRKAL